MTALLLVLGLALPIAVHSAEPLVDAMAREHAGDVPVASEAATAPVNAAVESLSVVYGESGGRPLSGYLARPAGAEGTPGVLVIHEWWGLNENVRAMARQLAAEGYSALAVDLYGGRSAEEPGAARELMQAAMADPEALLANVRQAHTHLKGPLAAPRTGTVGWCFGGGISLEAALALGPDLDAAVVYYGRVVTERTRLAALHAPLLGLFGAEDRGIPVEGVRAFEKALAELGKTAQIRVYEGAGHAFANPSGTRYQREAAEDAWARTLAFLADKLSAQ